MPQLKETPDWLRANPESKMQVGVDREKNILHGFVVAQEGVFKDRRGEFDLKSLKQINALMNKAGAAGLKSNFGHATLSADGLGKYLGRAKNPRLDSVSVKVDGETRLLHAVRADLHFTQTALEEPPGGGKPLGVYVMDLAESDPDAISSSLVLQAGQEEQLDEKKRPKLDANGEPLPPLWRPSKLHASDIVSVGAAVDGLLSAHGLSVEGLPDELLFRVSELLAAAFPGASREVISARVDQWKERYLSMRFGDEEPAEEAKPTGLNDRLRRRLKLLEG